MTGSDQPPEQRGHPSAGLRADAQRNMDKLLKSAKEIFDAQGVDAPVREIAKRAGVGIGTLYRHFPTRADLLSAVFSREIDLCAKAAAKLAAEYPPFEALRRWLQRFAELALTKRGLAQAFLLSDPAFANVPKRRDERIRPAFRALLNAAVAAGKARPDVDADEFLDAVSSLCLAAHDARPDYAQRMVSLFADSLRWGAETRAGSIS